MTGLWADTFRMKNIEVSDTIAFKVRIWQDASSKNPHCDALCRLTMPVVPDVKFFKREALYAIEAFAMRTGKPSAMLRVEIQHDGGTMKYTWYVRVTLKATASILPIGSLPE